ncbi:hypothetical protein M3654_23810, partial [Bacillus licheniformis]|nr:hypothetical protein [Bacillus licheniformis]
RTKSLMTNTRITPGLDVHQARSSTPRHRLRVETRSAQYHRPLANSKIYAISGSRGKFVSSAFLSGATALRASGEWPCETLRRYDNVPETTNLFAWSLRTGSPYLPGGNGTAAT